MKPMKRGEVYIVDFGEGIGTEQRGKRPAIIIQNNMGNKYSASTVVVPLTSKVSKCRLPTHIMIIPNWESSLLWQSVALCEQIRTISKERVGKFFGELSENIMEEIDKGIRISLAV